MIGRRRFLSFLGMAPVAGPMAAKAAHDAIVGELTGIATMPPSVPYGALISGCNESPANNTVGEMVKPLVDPKKAARWAYSVPALRDELESLLFAQQRGVSYFDPDIANKRSFSMAAKVAYQRQRNVQREIQSEVFADESPWMASRSWVQRAIKNFALSSAGIGLR